jgi:chromate transporter
MAATLTPDWPRRVLAVAAAAVALAWSTPLAQLAIIVAGAIIGYAVLAARPAPAGASEPSPVSRRVGVTALATFVALLVGLPLLTGLTGSQSVAQVDSMYRTGALVFGGGHVVLPLLHATTVDPGWVSEGQFLTGYGAAQAVPGPLFTFAAYLGAVSVVPPAGWLGGAICLVAIFLPSFLLIWGALPFWDDLRRSIGFGRALSGTNAAVVGLLAAALYNPVWTGAVSGWVDVAVAGIAFALLVLARLPPIVVVVLCAIAGQLVTLSPIG